MKSFKELVNEVLSKDAKASEWIDDFVNSDNPKFEGKSKEKRKEMALAAYYAKQRNEEVELDEATRGKNEMTSLRKAHDVHLEKALAANKAGDDEAVKAHQRKMQTIRDKMQKLKQNEEVELDEATKPYDQGSWAALKGKSYSENPHPKGSKEHLDWAKGHNATRAHKAQMEEAEITEQAPVAPSLVKHRIGVTVSEPDHPMVSKRKEKIQKFVIVTHSDNKEGARTVGEKFYKKKGYRVHDSWHAGINEEVELDESKEYIENHLANKDINAKVEGKTVKVHSSDVAAAKKHMRMMGYKDHKVVGGLNEELEEGWGAETQRKQADASGKKWDDLLSKHKDNPDNHKLLKYMRINNWKADAAENELTGSRPKLSKDKWKEQMAKHEKKFGPIKEDLDELLGFNESRGHKILARAMSRIATRQAVASGEIQPGAKPNETEQEKAKKELKNQQKTKAVDEETELDEMSGANMSASDIHKHLKKNGWSLSRTKGSHDVFTHPSSPKNIAVPRHKGDLKVPTVLQILKTSKVQEDTNMIGYKEFTEMIEEGKMDDLKDRLAAAREKRLNDYDFSKEKDEPKSNVTKHSAKPSDDDASDPEEKRGRGRPAGSKSGARR